MDPKTNGQELAFPFVETREMQGESISFGLTKREHFAAMAMQGLALHAIGGAPCDSEHRIKYAALDAVKIADALLRALAAGGEG